MNIKTMPAVLALSTVFLGGCDSGDTHYRPPSASSPSDASSPDVSSQAPGKKLGQPAPPLNQQSWESHFSGTEKLSVERSP